MTTEKPTLRRKDLLYPDLCFKVIGVLFEVYNSLGYGYKEKYYQRAIALGFKNSKILFKEQSPAKIRFKDDVVGTIFFDFLIENKIILEIKKTDRFSRAEIDQILGYLKASNLKLGLLAHFTKDGIKYKRILNIKNLYIRINS